MTPKIGCDADVMGCENESVITKRHLLERVGGGA